MVERTEDGRYIVVDGKRWRASDPNLADAVREQLVAELMSARRAVRSALVSQDDTAESAARRRVNDAKVALGERGTPWWEQGSESEPRRSAMERSLARERARHPGD